MRHFDVFNGDADGICALHQLRLHRPLEAIRVTGVKRDIALLDRVLALAGDEITVLDISMEQNQAPLRALLDDGVKLRWFDHHRAGDIPSHPGLEAHIDTAPEVCTSLLVDRWLEGKYKAWAVVAAFGDNLDNAALHAARDLALNESKLERLRMLGEALNYNAYGESVEDLHFHPETLFEAVQEFADPFAFIQEAPQYRLLREGYEADMLRARNLEPHLTEPWGAIYAMPPDSWARRVSGVWANELAQEAPKRAHAVLTRRDGGYQVSVRAPLHTRMGADEVCIQFEGGGGRKAAAGINHLHDAELERFFSAFGQVFGAGL
ncbi:MAG TPA: acetyltransferase [Burkholderiales bacterium]|nr:acetyltransferase [Burkholderiales bacterium]